MEQEILEQIEQADLVLIGLGEEFDAIKKDGDYQSVKGRLEALEQLWLLPAYDEAYRIEKYMELVGRVQKGLNKLAKLLSDKNYFVVSTAMNPSIAQIPWREGRLVMPCGSAIQKQCSAGCAQGLQQLSSTDLEVIREYLSTIGEEVNLNDQGGQTIPEIGYCPECGKPLQLNNIYAEGYDEKGYLSQWELYTKWLQGTLNKRLLILELGVGMKFPSVIRFPFEKVAYFNQKAYLVRINEKLYHLTEELNGKGVSISQNSIDWLASM